MPHHDPKFWMHFWAIFGIFNIIKIIATWQSSKATYRRKFMSKRTNSLYLFTRAWRKFCIFPMRKAKSKRPTPMMAMVKRTSPTK